MQTHAATTGGQDRGPQPQSGEYLSFRLGAEEYAIDILKVQEIRAYEQPTRIANVPPYIRGVINLRGVIVPVADLRLRFGLASADCDRFTITIVLNLGGRVIGVVVDSVSDVLALPPDAVRCAPEMPASIGSAHVLGLATVGERMLILLDIESMILSPQMAIVD